MRATWLPQVLRQAGLTVFEVGGWETRGANGPFLFFNPRGVVWHHTATSSLLPTSSLLKLLIDGRADLPGPLANSALERNGVYYVIASGRANHAGSGSWLDMDSNYEVIGIEPANNGRGEPWPQVQLDAYRRGTRAILDKLNAQAIRMCGHKEWAPARKIDPYGLNMVEERQRVTQLGDTVVIRPGESGNYIKPYQQALDNWAAKQSVPNWIPLIGSNGVYDGIYGPNTTAAITRYQNAAGLQVKPEVVLGQLDDLTRDLLERYVES